MGEYDRSGWTHGVQHCQAGFWNFKHGPGRHTEALGYTESNSTFLQRPASSSDTESRPSVPITANKSSRSAWMRAAHCRKCVCHKLFPLSSKCSQHVLEILTPYTHLQASNAHTDGLRVYLCRMSFKRPWCVIRRVSIDSCRASSRRRFALDPGFASLQITVPPRHKSMYCHHFGSKSFPDPITCTRSTPRRLPLTT